MKRNFSGTQFLLHIKNCSGESSFSFCHKLHIFECGAPMVGLSLTGPLARFRSTEAALDPFEAPKSDG